LAARLAAVQAASAVWVAQAIAAVQAAPAVWVAQAIAVAQAALPATIAAGPARPQHLRTAGEPAPEADKLRADGLPAAAHSAVLVAAEPRRVPAVRVELQVPEAGVAVPEVAVAAGGGGENSSPATHRS
jgi:hypothetical protein